MRTTPTETTRQIVGFSLPPEVAREVKAEAAHRGLTLKKLFEEMWELYRHERGEGGNG